MKLHVAILVIFALAFVNVASSQTRVPLAEDRITLPDYSGIFAIDGGRPLELTKPMDDFTSEPSGEVSPMAEFVFYGVGNERRLIRILSQEEYNQQKRRRAELANSTFTWDKWFAGIDMQMSDFAKSAKGLFANEEEVQMMNKLVDGEPRMVRQIPSTFLALGDYRIGDGIRWYKIRVVSNPKREADLSAGAVGATYEPVNYKKLASPTYINDFNNKRVQFSAMFLGEWTVVEIYKTRKVSTANKVFIAHRDVGYSASETGLGSSDIAVPPFAISLPKEKSDIIYEMNRGDTFTVRGLARKYEGIYGSSPGLEILTESIEVKK